MKEALEKYRTDVIAFVHFKADREAPVLAIEEKWVHLINKAASEFQDKILNDWLDGKVWDQALFAILNLIWIECANIIQEMIDEESNLGE